MAWLCCIMKLNGTNNFDKTFQHIICQMALFALMRVPVKIYIYIYIYAKWQPSDMLHGIIDLGQYWI